MRKLINSLLKPTGYQLVRPKSSGVRASMSGGLAWLSQHQGPINTVIDVGASDGRWARLCLESFPNATYLLFEPNDVHAGPLEAFIRDVPQRMIPIKKAVGGKTGETYFHADSDPFGGAVSQEAGEHVFTVPLTTLDAEIQEHQPQPPFLIKLDTHGVEQEILQGAESALEQTDVMIIEAYNHRFRNDTLLFWELCSFLDKKGFRPVDLVDVMHRSHDGSLWQCDLIFVRSTWKGFQHVQY